MTGPPALVLGLNPNALGTLRALHRAGIPAIGLDRAPRDWRDVNTWMSSRTRLGQRVLLAPDGTDEDRLEAIVALAQQAGGPLPVIPSGDGDVSFLLAHADRLESSLTWRLPEPAVVERLMDKHRFQELARGLGIPVPATLYRPSVATLDADMAALRYPVVLKPLLRDAAWDSRFPVDKGFAASGLDQLRALLEDTSSTGTPLMVQEQIPGADDLIYFSHVYLGEGGTLLARWTGRKLRQLPIHFGSATAAETIDAPEVLEATLRLLRAVDYRGYASVEFRLDPRDGRFVVLDAAIGRTCYHHGLGLAAGINIPAIWYRDLVGGPAPPGLGPVRQGLRWIDEYRDLIACADYRAVGELRLVDWVRSLRRLRAPIYWSLRDPAPFLFVLLRLARSALNAVGRRLLPRQ